MAKQITIMLGDDLAVRLSQGRAAKIKKTDNNVDFSQIIDDTL